MPLCKICLENIAVGQQMAVISFPVKNISKVGDYDFLGDFTDNQELVHNDCLRQIASTLVEIFSGSTPNRSKDIVSKEVEIEEEVDNSHLEDFTESVKALGDTPKKDEIKEFLADHNGKEVPDLIKLWFRNRNKVAHAV